MSLPIHGNRHEPGISPQNVSRLTIQGGRAARRIANQHEHIPFVIPALCSHNYIYAVTARSIEALFFAFDSLKLSSIAFTG